MSRIHPMESDDRLAEWGERLRLLVPIATCIVTLILMSFPLFTPVPVLPHLPLLAVLCWVLFSPSLMPPWVALPIGVLTDAALGVPLGVNAALMPAAAITVAAIDRRFADRPFELDWALAAILILSYQLLSAQLIAFATGVSAGGSLFVQAVSTILAYPIVVLLLARLQRRLVAQ
ncbi:MAG: rod shape-determining protein MreD [Alphaproteobacteria bacterium]|nr:rod shape-determining protein MreD [Alphaproteobacteria bacterium]